MSEQEIMELYEQYMDEETLEQIREEDEEEYDKEDSKETRKSHTESMFTKDNTISITKFVNDYLGIYAPKGDLWHSGLKELNSNLVYGVDNEYANEHPETVFRGELLLVIDDRGNRGTYINPIKVKKFYDSKGIDELYKEIKQLRREGLQDLKQLDKYVNKYEELIKELEEMKRIVVLLKETKKYKKISDVKEKMNTVYTDEGIGGRK